ncbi:MAG: 4'-phosphopantetheinyl transferase superfamily protein [Thermodesulfobacteriota bacterium]|nr:4'-phosphopantetheinyl transferase superfamily protein [Thermodesulfobacteriota bacterium]
MIEHLSRTKDSLSSWSPPPASPTLAKDEVHLWRAYLDVAVQLLESLKHCLSRDELTRAERFHFEKDRNRFIAARGVLRKILSAYCMTEPNQLSFHHNMHGKPALDPQCDGGGLRFNLSHSDGVALYAITRGREVGIDIERIRTDLEFDRIAERFFSPQEVATLLALPPHTQKQAFFACWTRKEAYVKARGDGLSLPLDQFAVSVAPDDAAVLLHTKGDPQNLSHWSLKALALGPDYEAALAVEGDSGLLRCWQWAEE